MKVIGAGLMRTATTTQLFALEQLGFGPCYHMRDLLAELENGLPLWEAVADGDRNWERIFDGAQSTVDWPSARYWSDLIEHYPDGGTRFQGVVHLKNGSTVLDRTTLTPLPDGRVRQVIEQSPDNGKNWGSWEGIYVKQRD